jgi:hypothetical protein
MHILRCFITLQHSTLQLYSKHFLLQHLLTQFVDLTCILLHKKQVYLTLAAITAISKLHGSTITTLLCIMILLSSNRSAGCLSTVMVTCHNNLWRFTVCHKCRQLTASHDNMIDGRRFIVTFCSSHDLLQTAQCFT